MILKKHFNQLLLLALIMSSFTENNGPAEHQADSKLFRFSKEITLTHRGDEYGEWGGDETTLKVYRDLGKKKMSVDLTITDGSANFPYAPKSKRDVPRDDKFPVVFEKYGVELSQVEMRLIEKSVLDLVKNKIRNEQIFVNAGIFNSVISSDSSLLIKDYPSIKWDSFHELVKLIKEK